MAGSWRLRAARALLAVGGVVLVCLAAEAIARAAGLRAPLLMIPGPANCLRRDVALSIAFRADCHGTLAGTVYSTNSLGLRGPPLRDDGSARILALGDSNTWGWRVGQDESYPARLQVLLDAAHPNPAWQVLNAGVPGYTSTQGLTYWRKAGRALRPAVVLIGFGWNDTMRLGDVEKQIAFERRWRPFILLDDTLLRHSRFYGWARAAGSERPTRDPRPRRVTPRAYRRNLEALLQLTREAGARALLLSFLPKRENAWARALEQVAAAHEVPVLHYRGPRLDLVHPTAAGYQQLAEEVLATLRDQGAVPR